MLDVFNVYNGSNPHIGVADTAVFLTYSAGVANDQQVVVWFNTRGTVIGREDLDYAQIQYAYPDHNRAMLVQFQLLYTDDGVQPLLIVHAFSPDHGEDAPDTLYQELLSPPGLFYRNVFDAQDGELTAAMLTFWDIDEEPTWDELRMRMMRYTPDSRFIGDEHTVELLTGMEYIDKPALVAAPERGAVLAYAMETQDGPQIHYKRLQADGHPLPLERNQPLTPGQALSGLELRIHAGTLYTAYTAQSFSDTSGFGTYLMGFPLREISMDVPPRPEVPQAISLTVYPNPFNGSARLQWTMPAASSVSFRVYDVNGRLVQTLPAHDYAAGTHTLLWAADPLPSGVYFLRLSTPHDQRSFKAVLLR